MVLRSWGGEVLLRFISQYAYRLVELGKDFFKTWVCISY